MAHLLHDHLRSSIVKKSTKSRTFWMHNNMAEDKNFNTLCIGRVTHCHSQVTVSFSCLGSGVFGQGYFPNRKSTQHLN